MDDATLIQILEMVLNHPALSRLHHRYSVKYLPGLRGDTSDPDDHLDLVEIAAEYSRQQPGSVITVGQDTTSADSTVTIGTVAGCDVTQHNHSGGVNTSVELIRCWFIRPLNTGWV